MYRWHRHQRSSTASFLWSVRFVAAGFVWDLQPVCGLAGLYVWIRCPWLWSTAWGVGSRFGPHRAWFWAGIFTWTNVLLEIRVLGWVDSEMISLPVTALNFASNFSEKVCGPGCSSGTKLDLKSHKLLDALITASSSVPSLNFRQEANCTFDSVNRETSYSTPTQC